MQSHLIIEIINQNNKDNEYDHGAYSKVLQDSQNNDNLIGDDNHASYNHDKEEYNLEKVNKLRLVSDDGKYEE